MKSLGSIISLSLFLFLYCFGFAVNSSDNPTSEYLVKIRKGQVSSFLNHISSSTKSKSIQIQILRSIPVSYASFFVVRTSTQEQNVVDYFSQYSEVEKVEPNIIYSLDEPQKGISTKVKSFFSLSDLLNDTFFPFQWNLRNLGNNELDYKLQPTNRAGVAGVDIDLFKAWTISEGSRNVKIALVDTGIDYNHPDLKDNVVPGYNFVDDNADPKDISENGHGTHVGGIIGAISNNSIGTAGIMKKVSIVPLQFLDKIGTGTLENALRVYDYAVQMNVDIISNSWGAGRDSEFLREGVKRAIDRGIVVVASAGNTPDDHDRVPHFPSGYDGVISVSSHTNQDQPGFYSNYGIRSVHIFAPGENIISTLPNNSYGVLSGTSMAAPHVAAAIGLLIAKEGRKSPAEIKDRLIKSSVPGYPYWRSVSQGRLNIYNFLAGIELPRTEPQPSQWKKFRLPVPFESHHPHSNDEKLSQDLRVPGAKYIRVNLEKFYLRTDLDHLVILAPSGKLIETLKKYGNNYSTNYIVGDTITVQYSAGSPFSDYGFSIKELEYVE